MYWTVSVNMGHGLEVIEEMYKCKQSIYEKH